MAQDKNQLIGAVAAELQALVVTDNEWQAELKRLKAFKRFDSSASFDVQYNAALRLHVDKVSELLRKINPALDAQLPW